MVPDDKYQMRCNVYGALEAIKRPVRDGADDRVRWYLDYSFYYVYIGPNV